MRYKARLTQEVILEIKDKEKFQQALTNYKESIDSSGDKESVLNAIAYTVITGSEYHLVEGVGYLEEESDMWCGVVLISEDTDGIELSKIVSYEL